LQREKGAKFDLNTEKSHKSQALNVQKSIKTLSKKKGKSGTKWESEVSCHLLLMSGGTK